MGAVTGGAPVLTRRPPGLGAPTIKADQPLTEGAYLRLVHDLPLASSNSLFSLSLLLPLLLPLPRPLLGPGSVAVYSRGWTHTRNTHRR